MSHHPLLTSQLADAHIADRHRSADRRRKAPHPARQLHWFRVRHLADLPAGPSSDRPTPRTVAS